MADFTVTPVAAGIKPIPAVSLADMIGIARGAQAYQQAEKINPLALQQQQQTTRIGEIGLGVEEQKNKERLAMQTVMADPSLYTTNGKYDPDKAAKIATSVAPMTGLSYLKDLAGSFGAQEQFKTAETGAQSTQMDFANKQVNAIAGRLTSLINNPLIIASEQAPNAVNKQELQDVIKKYGQEQATALNIPKDKAEALIQPYLEQTANPAGVRQFLKEKLLATVDQASKINTIGNVGVSTQNVARPNAPVVPAVGTPAGNEIAPGMRLPYQVRRADQPYLPEPSEKADLEAGVNYRNRLVGAQTGLAQNRRNVEEVIGQANKIGQNLFFEKGGVRGQIEQKIRSAIGSAEYDMLAKDLANMALSNTQAMGGVGNTVAGLDMQQVANGTVKVPPDVLVKIARRVQADQTNLDMQANGAQAFSQRFGDNNMKAYQQAWNANADTKIFEAMNIIKDVSDPTQREKELNRLFPDEKKRADFLTKYRNLKKLSETGSL